MSLIEPSMAISLSPTLSLDDLPTHCPRPDLGRTMSLPYVKKKLRLFRRDASKRIKIALNSQGDLQLGGEPASLPSSPATDNVISPASTPVVPQVSSPVRKRILVQQWLIQQSERFGRFRPRFDSLLPDDTRKELQLASEDTKCTIAGPDGEPLPASVIDDFFKLYAAGGSDWRESWRWEAHLDKWEDHRQHCSKGDCSYCRTMREAEETPPPRIALSPRTSYGSSSIYLDWPKEPRASEDSHFSIPLWRRGSKSKGKEPAEDQDWDSFVDRSLVRPQRQSSKLPLCPRASQAPAKGIVIQDAFRRQQMKPVRCWFSATPLDPRQIPVPALPELYPKDSDALNLSDLCHITGRLSGASPLEEGRLSFPLLQNPLPPPTPELRPEQRLTPEPESLELKDSSQAPLAGGPFNMPSLARLKNRATKIQRGGFPGPVTLINASSTTPQSALATLLDPFHDRLSTPTSKKRNPNPSIYPLPTPPDSRSNSDSTASGIPDLTFGITGSLPARPARPMRVPTGPADRDPLVCTLSDTTGSPLPDCPVYVNPREARDRKNESMARRHWPGGCIWRYHCDD